MTTQRNGITEGAAPSRGERDRRQLLGLALLALTLTACDFEVTNPGPVQDEFLDDPTAFAAVVNGMGRGLADAMNLIAFHQSMVTRELFPTGGTGQFGISVKNADGILADNEQGGPWSNAQRARWMAEDGIRRFRQALGESAFNASPDVAQAYLWAGYANRLLGENMCEAVIDVGPLEPRETFLQRAEENFTNAIRTAQAAQRLALASAATAGRAAVRVHLGDWAGAAADAATIPTDFAYRLSYYDIGDIDQYNRIAHAGGNNPYKTHTVWGTFYESYYVESKDPRVAWVDTKLMGDGSVSCCGKLPFYRQMKYANVAASINLSTGREMRLIEAEARLVAGDLTTALQHINALRTASGMTPWTATTLEEGWTHLKRERGIELWLEARRLGDLYRWNKAQTPGELHAREVVSPSSYLKQQDLCFPIPENEWETNPNLKR